MENLFSTLASSLPKPKTPISASPQKGSKTVRTIDLVSEWQKSPTPELTSEVLARLKPTIDSALNTYAPKNRDRLEIRATKLALESLKGFDPSRGVEPSTFVFNGLKRLNRLNAKASNIIPVSEAQAFDRQRLSNIANTFEDEKGREPSIEELADLTGFSKKKIDLLLSAKTVVSESQTLSDDSGKDTLSKNTLNDNDYFEYVYSSVSPVDQKIMEWSSGLHGGKILSGNEIAKRLKISSAAVSQRKAKIQRLLEEVRSLL